ASMWPRSFDRGRRGDNSNNATTPAFASMWPRSFDRGRARVAHVLVVRRQLASMWPRSFDRGRTNEIDWLFVVFVASMWPRSFDGGRITAGSRPRRWRSGFNGAAVIRPRKASSARAPTLDPRHASMWPRSFDRGRCTVSTVWVIRLLVLQCGRG